MTCIPVISPKGQMLSVSFLILISVSTTWRQLIQGTLAWPRAFLAAIDVMTLRLQPADRDCGVWWKQGVFARAQPYPDSCQCLKEYRRRITCTTLVSHLKTGKLKFHYGADGHEITKLHFSYSGLSCRREGKSWYNIKFSAKFSAMDFNIWFCN